MPSFLSKVFGRKKDNKESPRSPGRVSDPELLDGKFESVSPSATTFPEVANGKGEKDASFALFRAKSRPASPDTNEKRANLPLLSLNLPGPRDDSASRALGIVFEADPDAAILLSDAAIGSRRLSPLETLILVRACSQAITARGLETLGIMHPHWYSASPEIQRRLISLFIHSLAPKSSITTLSPTSSAFISAFESEISSTRSPHDVAAVLRWGLRHLKLEGNSFGRDESWYKAFFDAERLSEYPANGFSTTLGPTLPASHLELLTATLEIFFSLASHAEANGISGSKLSKFFGLWLLTVQRAHANDDWATFYARWERTGRMLEHIFLARIRDEAVGSRMPTRLLELVKQYPYDKTPSPETEADLLPRPRFSTRRYDALFVRIETELSATADQPAHHPLRLISDAFKAEAIANAGEHVAIWESIRKAGSDETTPSPGSYPGLGRIFADETVRFFSLIPIENGAKEPTSPTFNVFSQPSRRRSSSLNNTEDFKVARAATSAAVSKPEPGSSLSPGSPVIGTDWVTFSTSGFFEDKSDTAPLAATLLDNDKDIEVTQPKPALPKPLASALSAGRKSLDAPRTSKVEELKSASAEGVTTVSKSTHVSLTQLDEAFIDFWSDALLDPISATWPAFVICKVKSTLPDADIDGKRLEWLVIEQIYKRPAPPTPVTPETATTTTESGRRPRPSSPKSFKSDTTFSSTRKRFSFWTSGRTSTSSEKGTKSKKKAAQGLRVGEMGEILAEEDEIKEKEKEPQAKKEKKVDTDTVRVKIPSPKSQKSTDVPRKSVDIGKKSVDEAAASLLARAAVVTGDAVVATLVSSEAVKKEEVAPPSAVPGAPATITDAAEAAVEYETPATEAKEAKIEVSAASALDAPAVEPIVAGEPVAVESTHTAVEQPTTQALTDELKVEETAVLGEQVAESTPVVLAAEERAVSEPVSPSVDLAEPVSAPVPVEQTTYPEVEPLVTPTEVPVEEEAAAAAVITNEGIVPSAAGAESELEAKPEVGVPAVAVEPTPVEPVVVEPEVAEPAVDEPAAVEPTATEPEVAPTPDIAPVENTPVPEPRNEETTPEVEAAEPAAATEEAADSIVLIEAVAPVEETTPAELEAPVVEAAREASSTTEVDTIPEAALILVDPSTPVEEVAEEGFFEPEAPAAVEELPVHEVTPTADKQEHVVEVPVAEEPAVVEAAVEEPVVQKPPFVEEPAAVEQSAAAKEPVAVQEPFIFEAAVAGNAATAEEPVVVEEPAVVEGAVEEPAVEVPAAVEEPLLVQDPVVAVEEPAVEVPAAVEEPLLVQDPVVVEEPVVAVEEPAVEVPAAVEEPLLVQDPVVAVEEPAVEVPAAVEEPLLVQDPVVVEEPVVAVEEPAVEVPAAVEEPLPVQDPVVVEEPVVVVEEPVVEVPAAVEEPTAAVEDSAIPKPAAVEEPLVEEPAAAVVEVEIVKPDEEPTAVEAIIQEGSTPTTSHVVLDNVAEPSEEAAPRSVEPALVVEESASAAAVAPEVPPPVAAATEAPVDAPVEAEASPNGDAASQPASVNFPAPAADAVAVPVQAEEEPKEDKASPQDPIISASTEDTTSSTPAAATQE